MKPAHFLASILACLALASAAHASDIIKANSTTSLNQAASWVSGGPPGVSDVAVWDATVTSATNYTLGASIAWGGLRVANPGIAPSIRNTSGLSLTLGAAGVDMSAATQNFTINPAVVAGTGQTWNIATGKVLLLVNGLSGTGVTVTKSGAGTLQFTGATTYASNLNLSAGTLQCSPASSTQILSGTISGTGGALLKDAAGALTLSGANTYQGGTTLSAGQLNLNSAGALGDGTGTLTITGGTLDNTSGGALTLNNNPQNWNTDITFLGSASLNLGGGAVTLNANRIVTVNANTLTVGGGISGPYGLTKQGAGTLALAGPNVFSGAVTVNGGNLVISGTNTYTGASTVATGTLTVAGGSLSATTQVIVGASGGTGTPVFNLTGGAVTASIAGNALYLGGTSGFPGAATISGGTFACGASSAVLVVGDSAVASYTQTGGTVSAGAAGGLWVANNAGASGSILSISGGTLNCGGGASPLGVRGSYTFTIGGTAAVNAGTLWLGHTGGTTNNPTGRIINLNGGTLALAGGIAYQAGTAVVNLNGGILKANASSSWNNNSNVTANVGAGGLKVDPNGYFIGISQQLSHDSSLGATPDGGLVVADTFSGGYLTLTGACSYTGPTTVVAGTLSLGPLSSIAASPVIDIQTSGTLDTQAGVTLAAGQTLQGTGVVNGNLTVASGATLSPGGPSIGTLTMYNSLTLAGNASFQIDKTGGVLSCDAVLGLAAVTYGGTLSVSASGESLAAGDSFQLFGAGTYGGGFSGVTLPALSAGLFWETSSLLADGTIKVVNTVPIPTFSPPSGRYVGSQSVTITSTAGATIHYTTDGSDPTSSITVISGASPLGVVVPADSMSYTLSAYASKAGATPSAVATAVYNTVGTSVWLLDGYGYWSDAVNWLNDLVADGSGITADFSTLTLSGNATIALDGPRTVGRMKFGDMGNSANWMLAPVGGDTLTLDAGATSPLVTVNNRTATIAATLAGSHGLTKDGAGTLVLSGANNNTGDVVIAAGTLQLGTGTSNGSFGAGNYPIAGGARLYLNYSTAVPTTTGSWSNKITGSGTLELNSAQAVNGSANWGPNSPTATPFGAGFTGTLQLDNGRIDVPAAAMGGITNVIIKNGAQFLAWSGTYPQSVTIAGNGWGESGYPSALRVAGGYVATWSGNITLSADAGILSQASGSVFTLNGSIGGPYECNFIRNGDIIVAPLAAVRNSYATTRISSSGGSGLVTAGNQYAFSTGALVMNGGALALNGYDATFANLSGTSGEIRNNGTPVAMLTVGSDNTSTSYAGSLINGSTGALGLTKNGTGTLTLSSATLTYTGDTTINQGKLLFANGGNLGARSLFSTVTIAGGATFEINPTVTALHYNVAFAGAGTYLKTGSFLLDMAYNQDFVRPISFASGAMIDVQGGTLRLGYGFNNNWAANKSNLNVAGGATFDTWDATSVVVNSLTGAGTVERGLSYPSSSSGAGTLTVGVDDGSGTFTGIIKESLGFLSIIKSGAGTQTLSGANTYTGTTTVTSGSLVINGSLSASSAVTVAAAGTLGGTGTAAGIITAAGTIAPGAGGAGTLKTGATTLTGTYACELDGASCDKLAVTGSLNVTGATLAISTLAGGATQNTYLIASYSGTLTGTFASVTGLPSGYTVSYTTANQIKLVGSAGFPAWAAGYGLTGGNALPGADPDHDGIPNAVEYVIGGNPAAAADDTLLPTLALVTANVGNGMLDYLKFTYHRTKASADASVAASCEYNTGLSGTWTAATNGVNGVVVQTTANGFGSSPQVDKVDVYVPRTLAAGGRLFGRLRVSVP